MSLELDVGVQACDMTKANSRTRKVQGGIIFQANRYAGGSCSFQSIFPPQTIQGLLNVLLHLVIDVSHILLEVRKRAGIIGNVCAGV